MAQFRRSLHDSLFAIRKNPAFWFALGATQLLLHWSQDLVPYLGTFAASVFSVWLMARSFDRNWLRKARPLMGLGLLFFPLTGFWLILLALHENAGLYGGVSVSWIVPILLLMACGYLTLNQAIARILAEDLSVDRALALSWTKITKQIPYYGTCVLFLALMWGASIMTGGYGFWLSVPVTMAFLRTLEDSIVHA